MAAGKQTAQANKPNVGKKPILPMIIKQLDKITEYAAENWTDKAIHTALGIGHDSWYKYKKQDTRITEAVERGREMYKDRMLPLLENTLEKIALGYEITETKEYIEGPKQTVVKKEVTIKSIAPKLGALIYLLQAIAPERYKSTGGGTANNASNVPVIVDDV